MPTDAPSSPDPARSSPRDLAGLLLDAQVRHHLTAFDEDHLADTVREIADALLDAAAAHPIADLVDADAIGAIVRRALVTVPPSAAIGGIIEMATDVAYRGPEHPFPIGDLVDRESVEALLDQALALTPVLERALERLTDSPLVGAVVSRFMARIVGEVLAANKAVTDKVPGLGSLMSFGTKAASTMVGAADKQLDGLLGDTVGKGGSLAVRRMNKIILETLRDPTTREAVLQIWDLAAAEPVGKVSEHVTREELGETVGAVQDVVVETLAGERVAQLGDAVVAAFFDRFGGYTPTELLDELDLARADLVDDLVRLAPGVIGALRASGELERRVRAQLAPFYASDEVLALLG